MPKIVRHSPMFRPSPILGGAAIAGAGLYGQGTNGGFNALGMNLASQGMGQQFARQQHAQGLYDQQQAQAQHLQHAHEFLDDLAKTSPEVVTHPLFRPFGAAIAHGMMDPRAAMAGWEAAVKTDAATKRQGQQDTQKQENWQAEFDRRRNADNQKELDAGAKRQQEMDHQKAVQTRFEQREKRLSKTGGGESAADRNLDAADPAALVKAAGNADNAAAQGAARRALGRRGMDTQGNPNTPESIESQRALLQSKYDAANSAYDASGPHTTFLGIHSDPYLTLESAGDALGQFNSKYPRQGGPLQAPPHGSPMSAPIAQPSPQAMDLQALKLKHFQEYPNLSPEELAASFTQKYGAANGNAQP